MPLFLVALLALFGAFVCQSRLPWQEVPPKEWKQRCDARLEEAKRNIGFVLSDDELMQALLDRATRHGLNGFAASDRLQFKTESQVSWQMGNRVFVASVADSGIDRFGGVGSTRIASWQKNDSGTWLNKVANGRTASILANGVPSGQRERFVKLFQPALDDCLKMQ